MTNLSTRDDATESTLGPGPGPGDRPLRWFFGVPFRARTYAKLLYLALAFPLGNLAFVGVTIGLSLGVGLLITLVGIPILVITLVGATVLAALDARLTAHLVGIEVTVPEPLRAENPRGLLRVEDGLVDSLEALVTAPTTWRSLVLLVAKFCYGVVAFAVLVTAGTVVTALLAAPFVYDAPSVSYVLGPYTIDTFREALAAAAVGLCGLFPALHLCNGVATAGGYLTAALLEGVSPPSDAERT